MNRNTYKNDKTGIEEEKERIIIFYESLTRNQQKQFLEFIKSMECLLENESDNDSVFDKKT